MLGQLSWTMQDVNDHYGCNINTGAEWGVKIWLIKWQTAMQSQKAVTAYFTSKQLLPFVFCKREGVIDSGIESIDFVCY